jgi:hypothetical protein
MSWEEDQVEELGGWGHGETEGEEMKQLVYAKRMGLFSFAEWDADKADYKPTWGSKKGVFKNGTPYPIFNLGGRSVLDIGGGGTSLLLKCRNVRGTLADPLPFPDWIVERYAIAGIEYRRLKGEDVSGFDVDEVWVYNVLEHTENPEKIVANALESGKLVRFFDWIDTEISPGHSHIQTEALLNKWLGGVGKVEEIKEFYGGVRCVEGSDEGIAIGRCYSGVFKGRR